MIKVRFATLTSVERFEIPLEGFFEKSFDVFGGHVGAGDEEEGDKGGKHDTKRK